MLQSSRFSSLTLDAFLVLLCNCTIIDKFLVWITIRRYMHGGRRCQVVRLVESAQQCWIGFLLLLQVDCSQSIFYFLSNMNFTAWLVASSQLMWLATGSIPIMPCKQGSQILTRLRRRMNSKHWWAVSVWVCKFVEDENSNRGCFSLSS